MAISKKWCFLKSIFIFMIILVFVVSIMPVGANSADNSNSDESGGFFKWLGTSFGRLLKGKDDGAFTGFYSYAGQKLASTATSTAQASAAKPSTSVYKYRRVYKTSAYKDYTFVTMTKKKAGESCTLDSNCESGLACKSGKCDQKVDFGSCKAVVSNGDPNYKFNFIMAFYGLSQDEIIEKGHDLTRAQFYRSQYSMSDSDFGRVIAGYKNPFLARLGLFEIEPFKSNIKNFNVFYVAEPVTDQNIHRFCPFLKNIQSKYSIIYLKRKSTSRNSNINTWDIEELGTAFNHEIGHTFGLRDEYYTSLGQNDIPLHEIQNWNIKNPNCDYNHPFDSASYILGKGYCTKWCKGVDAQRYSLYKKNKELYNKCSNLLITKKEYNIWLDFCTNNLDFKRYIDEIGYGIRYPGIVVLGNPSSSSSIEDACNNIYQDSPSNKLGSSSYYETNIMEFCYYGSLNNVWDLDIGKSCLSGTGCYFGCGGFSKENYNNQPYMGAFGDSFRPNKSGIMQGGPFSISSGPDFILKSHEKDSELPSYGVYESNLIIANLKQRLPKLKWIESKD